MIQLVQINILISTNACITQEHQGRRNQLRRVSYTSFSDYESTETKLFRAGLKHYRAHEERMIKSTRRSPSSDYHDAIDYERVL